MTVACAITKGRSSVPGMGRVLRAINAFCLCHGAVLRVCWIPSELRLGLAFPGAQVPDVPGPR
eukprot:10401554-Lingulodinium_polyedra.AAC.1